MLDKMSLLSVAGLLAGDMIELVFVPDMVPCGTLVETGWQASVFWDLSW